MALEKVGLEFVAAGWSQFKNTMQQFDQGIEKVDVGLTGWEKTMDRIAKGAMERIGHRVTDLVSRLPELTYELIELGAAVERQAEALDNMAQSAGTSGDAIVEAIQKASRFTIDRMSAMEVANRAMLLEVAKSPAEFERLTRVAVRLGQAMGVSSVQSINDFVTASGRQSKMIADNLGLMVGVEEANIAYAKRLGITADALTDAQKKQAFLNMMLDQGEEKIRLLGDATEGMATKLEKLSAATEDARTGFAELVAAMVTGADASGTAVDELADRIRKIPQRLAEVITIVLATGDAWAEFIVTLGDVDAAQAKYAASIRDTQEWLGLEEEAIESVTAATVEMTAAVDRLTFSLERQKETAQFFADMFPRIDYAAEMLSGDLRALDVDVSGLGDRMGATRAETRDLSLEFSHAAETSDAFSSFLERSKEHSEALADAAEEAAIEAERLAEEAFNAAAALGDEFVVFAGEAAEETDFFALALFHAADEAGASEVALASLAGQLGIYTEAEIEAALAAVALQEMIRELGAAIAEGSITIDEAIGRVQDAVAALPAGAEAMAETAQQAARTYSSVNREAERAAREAERNAERLAREMERLAARTGDFFVDALGDAAEGIDRWSLALFEAADAAGANAEALAELAGAMNLYDEEQIQAALNATAMRIKIEELAQRISEGLGIPEAMERLQRFRERLGFPEETAGEKLGLQEQIAVLTSEYNRLLRGGAGESVLAAILAQIQALETGMQPQGTISSAPSMVERTLYSYNTTATVGPNYIHTGMDQAAFEARVRNVIRQEVG